MIRSLGGGFEARFFHCNCRVKFVRGAENNSMLLQSKALGPSAKKNRGPSGVPEGLTGAALLLAALSKRSNKKYQASAISPFTIAAIVRVCPQRKQKSAFSLNH